MVIIVFTNSTGFEFIPLSFNPGWDATLGPLGPGFGAILLDTSLTFSPDGTVVIDGGDRSAFPAMEVWTYGNVGQDPYNLLYLPESTTGDLGDYNQQIPDVSSASISDTSDDGTQDDSGTEDNGDDSGCDIGQCDGESLALLVRPGFLLKPGVVLSQVAARRMCTMENGV